MVSAPGVMVSTVMTPKNVINCVMFIAAFLPLDYSSCRLRESAQSAYGADVALPGPGASRIHVLFSRRASSPLVCSAPGARHRGGRSARRPGPALPVGPFPLPGTVNVACPVPSAYVACAQLVPVWHKSDPRASQLAASRDRPAHLYRMA